jgi:hypothetical protein
MGNHTGEYVAPDRVRQYASVRSRNSNQVKVLCNTPGTGWIANGRVSATMRR